MTEEKAKAREISVRTSRKPTPYAGGDNDQERQAVLRAEAFDLKLQGHSQAEIGVMLGRDRSTISRWLKVEIEHMIAPRVEALREQESARLDRYLTKLEPKIQRGDVNAINSAVRISERRSRLMGLDMPVRIDANVVTTSMIDAELERLARELAEVTGMPLGQAMAEAFGEAIPGEVVAEQASRAALPWFPAPSDPLAGIEAAPAGVVNTEANGETLPNAASWGRVAEQLDEQGAPPLPREGLGRSEALEAGVARLATPDAGPSDQADTTSDQEEQ